MWPKLRLECNRCADTHHNNWDRLATFGSNSPTCDAEIHFDDYLTGLYGSVGSGQNALDYDLTWAINSTPTLTMPALLDVGNYFEFIFSETGGPQEYILGTLGGLSIVSPFLLATGKTLGDINLANLLPNLTTPDAAAGLAADGTSAAIVLFQVPTMDPVTFTTNNGTTLLPYDPNFLQKAPSQGVTTLPSVTPISIGSLIYAVALLQAPPAGVTPGYSTPITITAQQQGGQVQQAYLPLVPPPVLLVPGLWNKKTSMAYYESILTGNAPWSGYSNLIYSLRYDGTLSFANPESIAQIGNKTSSVVRSLQSEGVVVGRADVVAHSMGGLLLRAYSKGAHPGACDKILGATNTAPYRGLENRCQGQFHTIITLDTPEAGSLMASYLYRHEGDTLEATPISDGNAYDFWEAFCASRGAATVAQCLAAWGQPVNDGAIQSLEPNSNEIKGAPSPNIPGATWTAITATNESGVVRKLLSLFIRAVYSSENEAPRINRILRGQNDDVVSLVSQLTGPPSLYVTDPNLCHTGLFGHGFGDGVTDSPTTVAQAICWLQSPTNPSCSGAKPKAQEISLISQAQADYLRITPGRLLLDMPSTANLGAPVTLQVKVGGVRSLEIEQVGEDGADAHDTVNVPAGYGNGSTLTILPRVLGKVQFHITANFSDGAFDMADPVLNVSVDPSSIMSLRAEPELTEIVINGPRSTYQLHPEIKVRGLSDSVDVVRELTTYRLSSSESNPAATVDSNGRITGVHSGKATIIVQFEGHVDKLDVLVK